MTANVWIVIVNYRTANLVGDCLHSIAVQRFEVSAIGVLVIDNASGDGSVEQLCEVIRNEGWESWVSVLESGRNGGFAYGNNVGIKEALRLNPGVEYIMLLNPDTIVRKGAISALAHCLDSKPQVGIAGSQLENGVGKLECSAHNAPSPLGELIAGANLGILSRVLKRYVVTPPISTVPHECHWVSGASLMVRREVFESVGFLDEGYFLYFEEVDFCTRARNAGWKVEFSPASRIVHLEGAATGIGQLARRRPRYWFDSRRRYFVKHFSVVGLIIADVLWSVGRFSLALRRLLHLGTGGLARSPKWFTFDLLCSDMRSLFDSRIWKIR